jgi:integrase/recombinase XerC
MTSRRLRLDFPCRDPLAVRDKALMELLYSSALRLNEAIQLDIAGLDLFDGIVRVRGKGSVDRLVPVGSYARKALRRWLSVRREIAAPNETAVFVGRNGRRLTPRNVQKRIAEWARHQRIGMHVHAHMFRHSCGAGASRTRQYLHDCDLHAPQLPESRQDL